MRLTIRRLVTLSGIASALLIVQPDVFAEVSPETVTEVKKTEPKETPKEVVVEKTPTFFIAVRHLTRKEGFPEIGGELEGLNAQFLQISGIPFSQLVKTCAPDLSEATAYVLAKELSDLQPWSVGIIGGSVIASDCPKGAVALLESLRRKGKSVSIGLFQLSEPVVRAMGVSADEALDPCRNIALFSNYLMDRYKENIQQHGLPFLAATQALEDFRKTGGRETDRIHSSLADSLDSRLAEETAEFTEVELRSSVPPEEETVSSFIILASRQNLDLQDSPPDQDGQAGDSSTSQEEAPEGRKEPEEGSSDSNPLAKEVTDANTNSPTKTHNKSQAEEKNVSDVVDKTQPHNNEEEKSRSKEKNKQSVKSKKDVFISEVRDSSGRSKPSSLGSPRVEDPKDPTPKKGALISEVPSSSSINSKKVKVF